MIHTNEPDTITRLYAAGYRVVLERQEHGAYLRISRPGGTVARGQEEAYTLHIRTATLEQALEAAGAWLDHDGN